MIVQLTPLLTCSTPPQICKLPPACCSAQDRHIPCRQYTLMPNARLPLGHSSFHPTRRYFLYPTPQPPGADDGLAGRRRRSVHAAPGGARPPWRNVADESLGATQWIPETGFLINTASNIKERIKWGWAVYGHAQDLLQQPSFQWAISGIIQRLWTKCLIPFVLNFYCNPIIFSN